MQRGGGGGAAGVLPPDVSILIPQKKQDSGLQK